MPDTATPPSAFICTACRFRIPADPNHPDGGHPPDECQDFQEITRERNAEWWS